MWRGRETQRDINENRTKHTQPEGEKMRTERVIASSNALRSGANRRTWKNCGIVSFAFYAASDAESFISCCRAQGIDIKKVFMAGGRVIRIYKSECYPKGAEDYAV